MPCFEAADDAGLCGPFKFCDTVLREGETEIHRSRHHNGSFKRHRHSIHALQHALVRAFKGFGTLLRAGRHPAKRMGYPRLFAALMAVLLAGHQSGTQAVHPDLGFVASGVR